jgi:hypothetical protein
MDFLPIESSLREEPLPFERFRLFIPFRLRLKTPFLYVFERKTVKSDFSGFLITFGTRAPGKKADSGKYFDR